MARQFLLMHTLPSTFQLCIAAMTLLVCAIALLMCASHSRKWRNHWVACYVPDSDDPVIEPNTEATIRTSNGGESMFSGEFSVWKKNILMGGKCQLPDFSGVIIYDSNGNVAPAKAPRPLLTWK
ncbi:hypothetical protein I3843_15G010600 [Carya illinoinensis]|uniref:Uncharacterized protein n=1 Tax=Carya illinoinensis TaxID=32201 RepID=A0A8T1N3F0_CARIL|nr:hypothetical protein I3760_15G010800 [Carya illinoinensis]KAG6625916.1 hypothetical protein CIPAW_15G011700 [Carya illinoinensis]KAG6673828.1 hypothetical protein I3842_15G011500 [Carya illinoinensis]KAG7942892.1 hypothetical protein I3843_15G010600 [Carya illinoinensis]